MSLLYADACHKAYANTHVKIEMLLSLCDTSLASVHLYSLCALI